MSVPDFIASLASSPLAKKQTKKLAAERAKALAADPTLAQKEFQRARESLLGKEFGSQPAGEPCVPCMANAKAQRRAARMELVNGSLLACPEHAAEAARLRQDMDQVEHARLAKHVYVKYNPDVPDDLRGPPPGFLEPTAEELATLDISASSLAPEDTDFRAAVYKKDPVVWGDNPQPAYELVFRGSTLAPEDWQNNFAQNANDESSYYQRATDLGNAIFAKGQVQNVQLVGHSLGGGLASAAQGGSGSAATTFNSAGLHPKTVARYSKVADRMQAEPDKILAYQVEGEVLTSTQERGVTSWFASPAVGQRSVVPAASDTLSADDRHAMDEVIDAIEKRKSQDEATLADCVASKQAAAR
jgi:hypothetical protein